MGITNIITEVWRDGQLAGYGRPPAGADLTQLGQVVTEVAEALPTMRILVNAPRSNVERVTS